MSRATQQNNNHKSVVGICCFHVRKQNTTKNTCASCFAIPGNVQASYGHKVPESGITEKDDAISVTKSRSRAQRCAWLCKLSVSVRHSCLNGAEKHVCKDHCHQYVKRNHYRFRAAMVHHHGEVKRPIGKHEYINMAARLQNPSRNRQCNM